MRSPCLGLEACSRTNLTQDSSRAAFVSPPCSIYSALSPSLFPRGMFFWRVSALCCLHGIIFF